jgi:GDPmannose 4,6-dehydratase
MNALIFGIGGQDGHFLSALLAKNGINVFGVSRSSGTIRGDVGDSAFVDQVIRRYRPDYLFHLAANSSTAHTALFDNHHAISTGTLNVLEAVRDHCPESRVFLSGSAMQFRNDGAPIDEQIPFEARSPYAVSRIQSAYAARYYRSAFGLRVYFGYFFNHDSPLRSERHINQKVVRVAQRIAAGSREVLAIGNIEVRKEFNFAGDMMAAAWMLVNQDQEFEAVIGCGRAHSIREWVELCFGRVGESWENHIVVDEEFRPEYDVLVSKPSLLRGMGWEPTMDFAELADLMLGSV